MSEKTLSDKLFFLLSVPKCVCCKERLSISDIAFCPKCSHDFEEIKTRSCSRCSKKLSECSCTNEYLSAHYVKSLVKVFRYKQSEENRASCSLIYSLKHNNRNDISKRCATELAAAICNSVKSPETCIIVNVPRRRLSILKYGMDHSAILAKKISKLLGATYTAPLASRSKREQKTLQGEQRIHNADFYIKHQADFGGKTVILVDDIVTTGASMGRCAMLLRSLGAKRIIGAALGIAYKDSYYTPEI